MCFVIKKYIYINVYKRLLQLCIGLFDCVGSIRSVGSDWN